MRNVTIEKKYVDFVYNFHQIMQENKLSLVYEGEVTQGIMKSFTALAEKNMDEINESKSIKMKVYHVMVECLQNILKHADDVLTGQRDEHGRGIFMVGHNEEEYVVTTANPIANHRKEKLQANIDFINDLSEEAVKEYYKKNLREGKLDPEGNAGLGLIDIVKKTGNPLQYHFEPVNDITSYFILRTSIKHGASALAENILGN